MDQCLCERDTQEHDEENKALEKENKSLKKFVKIVINVFSSGF